MQQYILSPKNFLINSDGWLGFNFWCLGDRARKKEKDVDQKCFEIAYKAFFKKMKEFYRTKKIEDEEKLFYLLEAVIDCKRKVVDKKG